MNLEGFDPKQVKKSDLAFELVDQWIYSRLNTAIAETESYLNKYALDEAAKVVYEFIRGDFCDWYVEATKLSFWHGDESEKNRAVSVLLNVLEESLRLLHPFIPFVTEEIYGKLPLSEIVANRTKSGECHIISNSKYSSMLINAPFPEVVPERSDDTVFLRFDTLKDLIGKVRALRTECGIDPASKINIAIIVTKGSGAEVCHEKQDMIKLLAGCANISFADSKPESSVGTVGKGFEAFVIVDDSINKEQLLSRFKKEIASESEWIKKSEAKLNGNFSKHAPAELVALEKEKMEESKRKIQKLESYIESL